jgi:hypothetical protein
VVGESKGTQFIALTRLCRAQLLCGAPLVFDQQLHHAILLVLARRGGNGKEAGLVLLLKLGLQGRKQRTLEWTACT